jgi:hypothetical protein
MIEKITQVGGTATRSARSECDNRRNAMCPACIATLTLLAAKATSTGGLAALPTTKLHPWRASRTPNTRSLVTRSDWLIAPRAEEASDDV